MCKIPNWVKIPFFPMKNIFFLIIGKFLKFKEMEYLIHYIENMTSLISCNFPIRFSTVKLKLRQNFFKVFLGYRNSEFWSYAVLPVSCQFTNRLKIWISRCCCRLSFLIFTIHETGKIGIFKYRSIGCRPIFPIRKDIEKWYFSTLA